jgi:hypothetical protein
VLAGVAHGEPSTPYFLPLYFSLRCPGHGPRPPEEGPSSSSATGHAPGSGLKTTLIAGAHPVASPCSPSPFPLAWPLISGPSGPTRQRRAPRRPLPSALGRRPAGPVRQRASALALCYRPAVPALPWTHLLTVTHPSVSSHVHRPTRAAGLWAPCIRHPCPARAANPWAPRVRHPPFLISAVDPRSNVLGWLIPLRLVVLPKKPPVSRESTRRPLFFSTCAALQKEPWFFIEFIKGA